MPLPLLAVIALIAAGIGGTIALAAALWPNAKGKTVLLLGSNLVGKTTLAEFLAKGTIPESYVRTAGTKYLDHKGDIRVGDLSLTVDRVVDVPGEELGIRAWFDNARQADLIVYLLDHSAAHDPAAAKRVRRDCSQLADWRKRDELKKEARALVLVTHLDDDDRWREGIPRSEYNSAYEVARATPAATAARSALGPDVHLIASTLATKKGRYDAVFRVLEGSGWAK